MKTRIIFFITNIAKQLCSKAIIGDKTNIFPYFPLCFLSFTVDDILITNMLSLTIEKKIKDIPFFTGINSYLRLYFYCYKINYTFFKNCLIHKIKYIVRHICVNNAEKKVQKEL